MANVTASHNVNLDPDFLLWESRCQWNIRWLVSYVKQFDISVSAAMLILIHIYPQAGKELDWIRENAESHWGIPATLVEWMLVLEKSRFFPPGDE